MAATAYAAAISLLNTMDNIKIHPLLSNYFNINYSIESLREKVDFFVDFVEKYADAESEEAEDLLRQIADVAHEAEEIINFEAADGIRAGSTRESRIIMIGKLKKITQKMDCVKEKAMKAKEEMENCSYAEDLVRRMAVVVLEDEDILMENVTTSSVPSSSSSSPPATAKTTTMVGFDGYVDQLLDQLTGYHSSRQILPIVGMGGIGKTTLAKNVYHNSLMMHHFDIRAWITVSQDFTAKKIILQALSCLGGSNSNIDTSKSDDELGEELFKILYGRRYLIVLDDMWSVEAWEKIMFFFPENNNGSRIIVTTRESELVDYFGSSAVAVDFLDEKNSWELFCEKTFAQQVCPHPELQRIGKKIIKKCKGLPLAITVIGGLLRESPITREYWEKITEDKSLILDSRDGNIKPLSILYLSYKHLPIWLKPCFLYLGLFPEDHEIEVSQLIKLWVAEGFIRSKTEQSLEEVAESYTKELVDRNLLLVVGLTRIKKLKSCRVHDVVRELCIRIAEKETYFCVQRDIDGMRHYIVDESTTRLFYPRESQETLPSLYFPLILDWKEKIAAPYKSRLSRVSLVPLTYLEQVNLRFLCSDRTYAMFLIYRLHLSIQILWSLQTLIIDNIRSFDAPCEMWKMPQLRHIQMNSIYLPDPPCPSCEDDVIVLHNLQTLKTVVNFKLSEEVCKRIPNIKELGIDYNFNERGEASRCNYHLQNLGCFTKLESLQLYCNYPVGDSLLKLPSSIKELTLYGCKLVWSTDMKMIASLPHLQFLELKNNAVVGPKWDCVEGEFLCLCWIISGPFVLGSYFLQGKIARPNLWKAHILFALATDL